MAAPAVAPTHSDAELRLLNLDLRASQARKIVAALQASHLELEDLQRWTPAVAQYFLLTVFPAIPERKLSSLLRRLRPLLSAAPPPDTSSDMATAPTPVAAAPAPVLHVTSNSATAVVPVAPPTPLPVAATADRIPPLGGSAPTPQHWPSATPSSASAVHTLVNAPTISPVHAETSAVSAIHIGFGHRMEPPAGDRPGDSPSSGCSKAYKHREMIDQANQMCSEGSAAPLMSEALLLSGDLAAPCTPCEAQPDGVSLGVGTPREPPATDADRSHASVSLSEALAEAAQSHQAWKCIIEESLLVDPSNTSSGSPRFRHPMADLPQQPSKLVSPTTSPVKAGPLALTALSPAAPVPVLQPQTNVAFRRLQLVKAREACRPRRYRDILDEQGHHLQQLQDADNAYRRKLQAFFDEQERMQSEAMTAALEAPPWDLVFGLTMFAALHSSAVDGVP
eukprot:GGOE01005239.1.p1 GENE.GGOE01005239.1~~GGOE01005239.1.p1  ORF type:complete len:451 (-),score=113.80 GGOE01005239.1:303-1655(-)